jgi:hypothetical protein
MVNHSNDQQCQAHLASAEYRGIHSAYGKSNGHKLAVENRHSPCKNRVETAQRLTSKTPKSGSKIRVLSHQLANPHQHDSRQEATGIAMRNVRGIVSRTKSIPESNADSFAELCD